MPSSVVSPLIIQMPTDPARARLMATGIPSANKASNNTTGRTISIAQFSLEGLNTTSTIRIAKIRKLMPMIAAVGQVS